MLFRSINNKLKTKTLAIIEPRTEYKRDKTWSFWKVVSHNFDDCVIKSWKNFTINIPKKTNHLECASYPYQSVDSGLFYKKINNKLKENKNISFFKDIPIGFRFSILVARRVYRKIGHKILNTKNLENYKNSGKVYVSNLEKIFESFLSIFDLVKLSLKSEKYDQIQHNHNLITEEINLDERI